MTLTEWLADNTLNPAEWECLLDDSLVLGQRRVSGKRVAAAQEDDYWAREIAEILR